ncbi:hypothetical protein BYT27DRAFT_7257007 [Phlegmacium glaucopus]|nr:hypothetical protein BYT27DRAFT_7257007 [Phlegmacium glaucopus]
MPALKYFQRSNSSTDSSTITVHSPITIAGITAITLVLFVLFLWLGFRIYRKRAAAKRESKMGATFLSVKGLVQDDDSGVEKHDALTRSKTLTNGFSRQMIDSTVILPEKAAMNSAVPRESQSGTFPRSFARTSVSFLPAAGPRPAALGSAVPRLSQSRDSFVSLTNSYTRFSVVSGTSSLDVSNTSGAIRKVRQKFEPVLPDELLPSLGEQLTVIQSFDDGWCVVGRENSTFVHTAKSLFKPSPEPGHNIELGAIPAWCFLKPVKGLRAERPIRSTSLGITINMDGPARNELVSWSNF